MPISHQFTVMMNKSGMIGGQEQILINDATNLSSKRFEAGGPSEIRLQIRPKVNQVHITVCSKEDLES